MEEKILIKSEPHNFKKLFKVLIIIGVILFILMHIISIFEAAETYDRGNFADFLTDAERQTIKNNTQKSEFVIERLFNHTDDAIGIMGVLLLVVIYLWLRSYELTVTDKRIYGKLAWGKRVDLPLDSVSATATLKFWKGISVSTASGRINFLVIKNADEIYKVISNLLINRQQEKNIVIEKAPATDEVDQLKKYKDLLDSGVITQEEFDAKKKQLLGL